MISWIRNSFHLPEPSELGWSDHNALGSRDFTPFQPGKTWEDWNEHVKQLMPVRYFMLHTIPFAWYPWQGKLRRAWYWMQCHTMKKHRWHLFDLRGVDPLSDYTHGYIDPSTLMEIAAWGALRRYVENGKPKLFTEEELAESESDPDWKASALEQNARRKECFDLHAWWMTGRAEESAKEEALYKAVDDAKRAGDAQAYREATIPWIAYTVWREKHAEDQLLRLVKLRQSLWT